MGLRSKLYALILPLILVVVLLSGVLAWLASRSTLTPIAARLLTYKAEQLRDFTFSEWETIASLGLEENEEFVTAAQGSFRSYATSLLRTETELIVVSDRNSDIVTTIGANPPELVSSIPEREAGWFTGRLLGEQRVGVVFDFEPYGWHVAVTELQSVFFTDAETILRTHIGISVIATISATILVWIFVGYQIKPIERLSQTIVGIAETQDLSRRVEIEFSDEVGLLGHEFNRMIGELEKDRTRLEEALAAESSARDLAISREEETLLLLGRVSEFRDKETADHLERIGTLSARLAAYLGYTAEEMDMLRRASALHDIGKIGISDTILLKPGKLTPEEFATMRRHTVLGYALLKDSKSEYLREGAEIALSHHEKWDGTGYPNGISGDDIPLSGRIVAVVDVFDALTSERPYKKAWTPEDARDFIAAEAGGHFDPTIATFFVDNFNEFRRLFLEINSAARG